MSRHRWTETLAPRRSERAREGCGRCGCVRLRDSRGRTRYYLPGPNPVQDHVPPCLPRSGPAWVECAEGCGEWWCRLHGQHAYECACPPADKWTVDPYTTDGPP